MKIIYRFSDKGYSKVKLPLVSNENCFKNFSVNFLNGDLSDLILIRDNCNSSTHTQFDAMIKQLNLGGCPITIDTNHGNAGSFNFALDYEIENFADDEILYFVEGDYIHDKNSKNILEEGYNMNGVEGDYVTLYAHPDKEFTERIQPEYIFRSENSYWRSSDSTTMTFSAKIKTLKDDNKIIKKWVGGAHPNDHKMFLELRKKDRVLVNPIPGYSTHGETSWLSPHKDWNLILENSIL
jgi:hypothetical protein